MTRREQIATELERLGRVALSIQARYGAFMQLHAAASAQQDKSEMVQRRDELHTVLDALLDNGEHVDRLRIELQQMAD